MSSEWAAAIKAADPMGFHDKSSPEEVAAARAAGSQAFETAANPYAPKWTIENPDPQKMRELYTSLGGRNGSPMDPKKVKDFKAMLHEKDPLRDLIDRISEDLGSMTVEGEEECDGGGAPDPRRIRNENINAHMAKNAGETEGGADGKTWRWEQTSRDGESEILVRFTLASPATKKDVKVVFKAQSLKVTVAGDVLFDGKTFGKTYPDESTWSLVEQGAELQVLISLAEDVKWEDLAAK